MTASADRPELRPEVLAALRDLATRGASVRTLTDEIRTRLNYPGDSVITFLWYFSEAFALPLREVLPLREWLGSGNDAEIDALLLPRIANSKDRWTSEQGKSGRTVAVGTSDPHGLTAAKQRG